MKDSLTIYSIRYLFPDKRKNLVTFFKITFKKKKEEEIYLHI